MPAAAIPTHYCGTQNMYFLLEEGSFVVQWMSIRYLLRVGKVGKLANELCQCNHTKIVVLVLKQFDKWQVCSMHL